MGESFIIVRGAEKGGKVAVFAIDSDIRDKGVQQGGIAQLIHKGLIICVVRIGIPAEQIILDRLAVSNIVADIFATFISLSGVPGQLGGVGFQAVVGKGGLQFGIFISGNPGDPHCTKDKEDQDNRKRPGQRQQQGFLLHKHIRPWQIRKTLPENQFYDQRAILIIILQ